jgi:hypothetical protein
MKSKHNILALVVGNAYKKKTKEEKGEEGGGDWVQRSSFFLHNEKNKEKGLNIDLHKVAFHPSENVGLLELFLH